MREAEHKDPCDIIDWQAYRFVRQKKLKTL